MENRLRTPSLIPSVLSAVLALVLALALGACGPSPTTPVRVGGKNFTEQLILAEIAAQFLESRGFPVVRHPGFGGTPLVHQALVSGSIDLYIEYTGTAWQVHLAEPPSDLGRLRQRYRERFRLEVLEPLGFHNGYAFIGKKGRVPGALTALAPLAPRLTAGFNAEFLGRPDGWPLIRSAYGFDFKSIANLDAGLIYRALDEGRADVVCGFSTDARLASADYQIIEDDLGFLPRYDAVPVARPDALERHPGLRAALEALGGRIDAATMRTLNHRAEHDHVPIPDIARDWLRSRPDLPATHE